MTIGAISSASQKFCVPARDRPAQVGAQHEERAVSQVDDVHHAENQRQACCEEEEQQPVCDPIEPLDDDEVRGHRDAEGTTGFW